jgi:MoaA/NifB/PqqE/SkfB family radical SAM enzyme
MGAAVDEPAQTEVRELVMAIMTAPIVRLPILVISAHSRCNCRCEMCDIWRNTETQQFTFCDLERQLPHLKRLGVESVVFTGGEALMNPDLFKMAALLRACRIRVTVLTSGLLLERYAKEIAGGVDDVIVSLDGPREIHDRIRGVRGAFDRLASGLRAVRADAADYPVAARCTVQKANHAALLDTAHAARSIGLHSLSLLAVNPGSEAFNHLPGKLTARCASLLLEPHEIAVLEAEVRRLLGDPVRAMVPESPEKLHRLVEYFRALAAGAEPRAPRCNAPWVSAVLDASGDVRPCFFHQPIGNVRNDSLFHVVNSVRAGAFRSRLDIASNPVCRRCVCSLYRPGTEEVLEATA